MNLCLSFHCLCESYDQIPSGARDLFVSITDMEDLLKSLKDRGYTFDTFDKTAKDSVTVTFDDGYYNNILFEPISQDFSVPYLIFVSAYYLQSGDMYPWLLDEGYYYTEMASFDYYKNYQELINTRPPRTTNSIDRPMTFNELASLQSRSQMEIGCHGYYHQPLSKQFEMYLENEKSLSLSTLKEQIGFTPRYFALANGLYTNRIIKELLQTFDKVLTIEGRPHRPEDKVVHRLTMTNPDGGHSLIEQIDRHLNRLRQFRRVLRTTKRLHF